MFPETRLSLIAALKEPDNTKAWERFALTYRGAIREWCIYLCKQKNLLNAEHIADDVTSILEGSICKKMKSYDASREEKGNYGAWLRKIVSTLLRDQLAQSRADKATGGDAFFELLQQYPDHSSKLGETFEKLYQQEVMEIVWPKLREAFGDRWAAIEAIGLEDGRAEGRGNAAEVARQYGMSVSLLYKIRSEARTMARQIVEELESDSTN